MHFAKPGLQNLLFGNRRSEANLAPKTAQHGPKLGPKWVLRGFLAAFGRPSRDLIDFEAVRRPMLGPCWRPKPSKFELKMACRTQLRSKRLLEASWGRILAGFGSILEAKINEKRMRRAVEHAGINQVGRSAEEKGR